MANPSRNTDKTGSVGANVSTERGPRAAMSLSTCWAARLSRNRRTGSRPPNCSFSFAFTLSSTQQIVDFPGLEVIGCEEYFRERFDIPR